VADEDGPVGQLASAHAGTDPLARGGHALRQELARLHRRLLEDRAQQGRRRGGLREVAQGRRKQLRPPGDLLIEARSKRAHVGVFQLGLDGRERLIERLDRTAHVAREHGPRRRPGAVHEALPVGAASFGGLGLERHRLSQDFGIAARLDVPQPGAVGPLKGGVVPDHQRRS